MTDLIRILYIDDYPLDRQLVRDALEKEHAGFQVTEAASRVEFEAALANGSFDLVLSDFNILGFEGLQVLEAVHSKDARIPVVIVTGTGSEEVAVEAMKRGAADYVIKTPRHIQRLPITIHAVLEKKYLDEEHKRAESLQEAVYQISEAASKAESLDELYQSVHAIIGKVMPAHNFYIALYDAESDLISFPYYVDETDRFTSSFVSAARPGRGMTEYVIRTGKPLLGDIANFEELARRSRACGFAISHMDWRAPHYRGTNDWCDRHAGLC